MGDRDAWVALLLRAGGGPWVALEEMWRSSLGRGWELPRARHTHGRCMFHGVVQAMAAALPDTSDSKRYSLERCLELTHTLNDRAQALSRRAPDGEGRICGV